MEKFEEDEFFELKAIISDKHAISRMLHALQEIAFIQELVYEYLEEENENS